MQRGEATEDLSEEAEATHKSWIINVTSGEGRFDKGNKPHHPQNNMSKAALNMISKTIGGVTKNIIVCSVDTGWVNNMVSGDQLDNRAKAILNYDDAVARIFHPFADDDSSL